MIKAAISALSALTLVAIVVVTLIIYTLIAMIGGTATSNAAVAPAGITPAGITITPQTTSGEVETAWVNNGPYSIEVSVQIAGELANLLAHAKRDGYTLGGWGYRSHERQKALRRKHCGPTRGYDPGDYTVRSSSCRPPTATPGRSMHETGLAIDFTCDGRSMAGTGCFRWLKANAARYGLYNLPSEPWHWSVNGR